jgi:hypothetical protein
VSSSELQRAFAAHIRDPARNPAPYGIDDRRMRIYRELFLRNVSSLLAGAFPVLHMILGAVGWSELAREFLKNHRCRTPLFTELPREFLAWLEVSDGPVLADVPFMRELAHYEWVETALDLADTELPVAGIDRTGDLLEGVPVLSPLAWPLVYRYPVHRLSPEYRPLDPPAEASCFVAWRNRDDSVRFMAVSAPTLRLVELMRDETGLTGRELLERVAVELPGTPEEAVLEGGRPALETLRDAEVILGVRATAPSRPPD